MIKVFSGNWRGLGEDQSAGFGMIIDFKFREILHEFKGAPLAVFMCLSLHSDENGHSFPGYELIKKETGYNTSTIGIALDHLCKLKIDGHRILMRYRERDQQGLFVGCNHYLIFPTLEELKTERPDLDYPDVDLSRCGKIEVEVKLEELKINQILSTGETEKMGTKGDLLDGMLFYGQKVDKYTDIVNSYPADVQSVLKKYLECWEFKPEEIPIKIKGAKAFWINGLRDLQKACAEYGLDVLHDVYLDWKKSYFPVSHPGALVRSATGKVLEKRSKNLTPAQPFAPQALNQADKEKLQKAVESMSNKP